MSPLAVPAGLLAMMTLLAGCASLTQPYPQKNLYAIALGAPPKPAATRDQAILRVQPVRIAKPYDERTFVYKTGESAYTIDYYNGFLTDPDRLLTGELAAWLSQSGPFAVVIGRSSADSQLTLETNVTAMYGDYSQKDSPKAFLEVRFVLLREQPDAYKVVFQQVYRQAEPLPGYKPDQLVEGWNAALRHILENLSADLPPAVTSQPTSQPAVLR